MFTSLAFIRVGMASAGEEGESAPLSPDEAFSALGNETRIDVLQTLGQAETPLSFTELRDTVGIDPGGLFNYHLDQLVGHFIAKTDDGYRLRAPGRRVVKAVLSGSIAEPPATDRERIDQACQLCGAAIEVRYHEDAVETFCTECTGIWGSHESGIDGYLGRNLLPPVGVEDRSAAAAYRASWTWMQLDFFAMATGLCPSCSASLETTIEVCEDHNHGTGRCRACANRYAARLLVRCTNCILDGGVSLPGGVVNHSALLDFLTDHGLNPVAPKSVPPVQRFYSDYDEHIISTDPFRADLTFDVRNDSISLTIDDTPAVIDVERSE